jgi:hypothetical protein
MFCVCFFVKENWEGEIILIINNSYQVEFELRRLRLSSVLATQLTPLGTNQLFFSGNANKYTKISLDAVNYVQKR